MNQKNQQLLLQLARKTIESYFKGQSYDLKEIPDEFKESRGVFITLHLNGELRGCIGCIEPLRSLYQGVKENALNASFNDPRFFPVTKKELSQLEIEISVLTQPKLLKYGRSTELLAELRPNIDGVILKKSYRSATFLPQVWEQLPDKVTFLEHLSLKAGLERNAWKTAEIYVYQAEVFSE